MTTLNAAAMLTGYACFAGALLFGVWVAGCAIADAVRPKPLPIDRDNVIPFHPRSA